MKIKNYSWLKMIRICQCYNCDRCEICTYEDLANCFFAVAMLEDIEDENKEN